MHEILINEKYVGNNVWNRHSFKLKQEHVNNPPDLWVRANGVFEPIVDMALFDAARKIILERSARLTDDEMLGALRSLLQQRGYLSGIVIDESNNCPSRSSYASRFGSILRCYELIGYTPNRDYQYVEANRRLREKYPAVVAETLERISDLGCVVEANPETGLAVINGEITLSLVLSRCTLLPSGAKRWVIRLDTGRFPDLSVVVRITNDGMDAVD